MTGRQAGRERDGPHLGGGGEAAAKSTDCFTTALALALACSSCSSVNLPSLSAAVSKILMGSASARAQRFSSLRPLSITITITTAVHKTGERTRPRQVRSGPHLPLMLRVGRRMAGEAKGVHLRRGNMTEMMHLGVKST